MSERIEDPRHREMTPLKVGGGHRFDHRYPKQGDFDAAFVGAVSAECLLNLLLTEDWHQHAEIIPNYVAPFARSTDRERVVVRVGIGSSNPNHEAESYSYLRYSAGPKQGFFWDIYGDDMQTVELAVLALSQAPHPTYCGPLVFRFSTRPEESK